MQNPPQPEKKPVRLKKHGDVRIDNYYWMRDREDPKVRELLEAENAHAQHALKPVEPLKRTIFEEMKARVPGNDSSVPDRDGEYFYFARFEHGKDYPIYVRKKGSLEAPEETLLDVNVVARGKSFCNIRAVSHSPNHRFLAFAEDQVGRNFFTICFRDLSTGQALPDAVLDCTGSHVWANDNQTFFYIQQHPDTLRAYRVYRARLGSEDRHLVYEEKDERFSLGLSKDKWDGFVLIYSSSSVTTEIRYLDANHPLGHFKLFQKRLHGHEYSAEFAGDRFYILTNHKAKNFKLMECPVHQTGLKNWKVVLAHQKDVYLESFEVFQNWVAVDERTKGLPRIQIWNRAQRKGYQLKFAEPVYVSSVYGVSAYDTDEMRFSYQSLTTPPSVFEVNMKTKKQKLLKQTPIGGEFDSSRYETKRVFAKAKDGAAIPIALVYKKGIRLDGSNPLLLDGYGSYGINNDPSFDLTVFSLLDRGFIYGIASIRGGSEMGRTWYENGKFLKKKNTFTDFISATEYLQRRKWTSRQKTYAVGRSAGGLLMGAVANMRPELYHGMLMGVPFVDVITTMLDDSLPLTTLEYEEWGNPKQLKYYRYIKSYSPYDQLKPMAYPHMLVTSGFHDSQVQYWEPTKYVAKLRDMMTNDAMVLLHTEMKAGHGGQSGRYQRLEMRAMEYAFLVHLAQA